MTTTMGMRMLYIRSTEGQVLDDGRTIIQVNAKALEVAKIIFEYIDTWNLYKDAVKAAISKTLTFRHIAYTDIVIQPSGDSSIICFSIIFQKQLDEAVTDELCDKIAAIIDRIRMYPTFKRKEWV